MHYNPYFVPSCACDGNSYNKIHWYWMFIQRLSVQRSQFFFWSLQLSSDHLICTTFVNMFGGLSPRIIPSKYLLQVSIHFYASWMNRTLKIMCFLQNIIFEVLLLNTSSSIKYKNPLIIKTKSTSLWFFYVFFDLSVSSSLLWPCLISSNKLDYIWS